MRKTVSWIFTVLLLLGLLVPASANSGPVSYNGVDGSVLTVVEDCPIIVTGERLTFTAAEEEDSMGRVLMDVSAVYEMENPTDRAQSVQMAFYLDISPNNTLASQVLDTVTITVGGTPVPFQSEESRLEQGGSACTALVYTVEFAAHEGRQVVVTCRTPATVNYREATHWTQVMDYLLSPAQSWADFGTLDIAVNTPEEYPYIVEASLPLEAAGERCYTAHFDGLPEGELQFTLYPEPKITLLDRIHARLSNPYFIFTMLVFVLPRMMFRVFLLLEGTAVIVAVVTAIVLCVKQRRRPQ